MIEIVEGWILMHLVVSIVAIIRFIYDRDWLLLFVSLITGWLGIYILGVYGRLASKQAES
jgi:hypothetical protein